MKKVIMIITTAFAISHADEILYRLPPIRHSIREERAEQYLNYGKQLMDVKGAPDVDDELVCTNWVCPTSIVVNAV